MRDILQRVANGELTVDDALQRMQNAEFLVSQLRTFADRVKIDIKMYGWEEYLEYLKDEGEFGMGAPFFGCGGDFVTRVRDDEDEEDEDFDDCLTNYAERSGKWGDCSFDLYKPGVDEDWDRYAPDLAGRTYSGVEVTMETREKLSIPGFLNTSVYDLYLVLTAKLLNEKKAQGAK